MDGRLIKAPSTEHSGFPRSVLFLCTRNVCRGPMAAALLERRKPPGCGHIIRSAGIEGDEGRPINTIVREVLYSRGIDLLDHRSRTATPNLLAAYDLILVMEDRHREWVEARTSGVADRTYLLGCWRDAQVRGAANSGRPEYERVAEDIEKCLADWARHLFGTEAPKRGPSAGWMSHPF